MISMKKDVMIVTGAGQPGADVDTITSLYKEMCRAMIAKDIEAMDRIHGDDFILVHMTGSRMNKLEYLEAVKDGTLNYYSADHDEIRVIVDGDNAVLRGRPKVNAAVYGGSRRTWRLQQYMRLKKTEGEWRFTYSQASTY